MQFDCVSPSVRHNTVLGKIKVSARHVRHPQNIIVPGAMSDMETVLLPPRSGRT